MIISHSKKFIFIKSVKTAGTSIQGALSKFCTEGDIVSTMGNPKDCGDGYTPLNHSGWGPHTRPYTIKLRVGDEVWNGYFKFCGVRNPWELMASYWFWNMCPGSFKKFLKSGANWAPLDEYWFDGELDYYIRFENLQGGFDEVCARIGLPKNELPHLLNFRKAEQHYSNYYDQETIQLVGDHYHKFIDRFGYKFEKQIVKS